MSSPDSEKQPLLDSGSQPPSTDPEPSLAELQQNIHKAQQAYFRAWSQTTVGRWNKRIMFGVMALVTFFMLFGFTIIATDALLDDDDGWMLGSGRVPLEAHIMSKCPDARDCLHDLVLPTMQRVGSRVDFTLSFIGRETQHDDGVECMHGPTECLGNLIELCAAHLYPDPKIYLGFTMCLSREYSRIPDRSLIEDCALEHAISMDRLNACAMNDNGELSVHRLQHSFRRTTAANVTKSCTVRLNDEVWCVRDGGEWKDCDGGHKVQDLVDKIVNLTRYD